MALFKCKMCGGDLEITNGLSVTECEYCGTKQTLPKLDDEKRANLYDRANHFRRNNEYDKAMSIYERILNEDKTDAEAYWSSVLCKYGIEYVEDPTTHKRVPTVNRAQYTSIFADEDYKQAIVNADTYQKDIYELEAKAIDEIQKGILEISNKEDPFDVFICYKETGNDGRRTLDSVLATELYHELIREGFKVFFSRITLEDKLGTAYEPYIFAALNSSKVMVVLGTKPEYFNAVWVKNEWSRYLALIKDGKRKALIPAYKDMDPYDLPEEFSHLQAQDMSKLGFMSDLVHGIKKITDLADPQSITKETVVMQGNSDIAPLLKRAFMFLEDGEWDNANEYCERILDINPECADAYLGKLMADLHIKVKENLKNSKEQFDNNNNYLKVVRFGDDAIKSELVDYIDCIKTRRKNESIEKEYQFALSKKRVNTESGYKEAAEIFNKISTYKDSKKQAEECIEKAEIARKDAILGKGRMLMKKDDILSLEEAIKTFRTVDDWKNSNNLIIECKLKIETIQEKIYNESKEIMRTAKYSVELDKAVELLKQIIDYRDCRELLSECNKKIPKMKRQKRSFADILLGL